jgi:NAD(P)-dependent dehydrogenase (short-subunit alcohol dehydrogenase family)
MTNATPSWPPKTAFITGASGSLGREISQRLARLGTTLILTDIDYAGLGETLQIARESGAEAHAIGLDVTDQNSWHAAHAEALNRCEHLDLFIYAAGVVAAGDYGADAFAASQRVVEVNLMGAMLGCHTILPWLKLNPNGGTIVNIASCAAFLPFPWMSAYNASKAGLVAFSRTLAAELWPTKVRVTAVCPGFFASRLLERGEIPNSQVREVAEQIFQQTPLTVPEAARVTLEAARTRPLMVVCPRPTRVLELLSRYFPGWLFYYIRREAAARRRIAESSAKAS